MSPDNEEHPRPSDRDPPRRDVTPSTEIQPTEIQPTEAEAFEDQLSGIGESHFDRRKKELKSAQAEAAQPMFGKLKSKFGERSSKSSSAPPEKVRAAVPPITAATPPTAAPPTAAPPTAAPPTAAPQPATSAVRVPRGTQVDEATIRALLEPLEQRLAGIDSVLRQRADAVVQQSLEKIQGSVVRQEQLINAAFQQLRQQIHQQSSPAQPSDLRESAPADPSRLIPRRPVANRSAREIAPAQETAPREAQPGPGTASGDWDGAVFGQELAGRPELARGRGDLLQGVLASQTTATALAGYLLLFQSAGDRRSQMLRDLGEAFYRWRPDADNDPDNFRATLVDWLMNQCEEAGQAHKIELVRPGDRFDQTRHHSTDKGAEITQVFGWVVLRKNGKVYTKANVAVK